MTALACQTKAPHLLEKRAEILHSLANFPCSLAQVRCLLPVGGLRQQRDLPAHKSESEREISQFSSVSLLLVLVSEWQCHCCSFVSPATCSSGLAIRGPDGTCAPQRIQSLHPRRIFDPIQFTCTPGSSTQPSTFLRRHSEREEKEVNLFSSCSACPKQVS